MNKEKAGEVYVEVKTEGFEEATQKMDDLTDAFNAFPSQVTFKYLRNCKINVYANQYKVKD